MILITHKRRLPAFWSARLITPGSLADLQAHYRAEHASPSSSQVRVHLWLRRQSRTLAHRRRMLFLNAVQWRTSMHGVVAVRQCCPAVARHLKNHQNITMNAPPVGGLIPSCMLVGSPRLMTQYHKELAELYATTLASTAILSHLIDQQFHGLLSDRPLSEQTPLRTLAGIALPMSDR
ncbi:hypothetical protein C8Q72DRAFT_806774 [Fomitopsis betulina]|nr:hypothetical protein C8Q72DRAFT_806774 [Fomitopsis betulina]